VVYSILDTILMLWFLNPPSLMLLPTTSSISSCALEREITTVRYRQFSLGSWPHTTMEIVLCTCP